MSPSNLPYSTKRRILWADTKENHVKKKIHIKKKKKSYPGKSKIHIFLMRHGTFPRIDHMLCHKTSLKKCNKFEIVKSTFSYHIGMRLESSSRKTFRKVTSMWKLKDTLLEFPLLCSGIGGILGGLGCRFNSWLGTVG